MTLEDQLTFGSQIAQGMAHLESKQVVHGRLSAFVTVDVGVVDSVCRCSVLVGSRGSVCKLSDVGHGDSILTWEGLLSLVHCSGLM